ncbi:MAG: CPBP family intramembrane glutamic endopeptidase, partial [Casimicrobiaceae bacterium]
STFWVRQVGLALLVWLGGGLALAEVFMAAEGLTRRAFPDHPQLWRLWSRDAAGTVEIAGRTAGGYLFVPIELALIAAFYYVTNQWLGWWQPSEALTDPNILSSVVPALTPISIALQAGFMEECVFRAVPLALGALLGARYGKRRLGIAIAFVLQAVVFGAAHANYPGFPSYSRLVELTIPSLLWALIFLRYGLLPTIILHALFDLALISIPLFLVDAPGAWVQRALVIAAALVPAAIPLARRVQSGAWGTLSAALRNGAWAPPALAPAPPERAAAAGVVDTRASLLQRALPLLGVAGLAAWFMFTTFRADVPPLPLDRDAAEAAAVTALAQRGVVLGAAWQRFAAPRSALDEAGQREWHAFVWREAGAAAYRALIGRTLAPPLWEVRFARFDGDVAERAEEWRVTIAGDGTVRQVVHRLPEGRAGPQLERDAAQAIVERVLRERLALDVAALQLRSAEQTARPARRDWTFTYADPRVDVGKGGEARTRVVVAGDEVVLAGRSVFVPEAWERVESEREGRRQLAKLCSIVVIALAAIGALIYAVVAWGKGRSDRRASRWVAGMALLLVLAGAANNWPVAAMQLKTAEPVVTQVVVGILGALAGGLLVALLLGLLAGVGAFYARNQVAAQMGGRVPAWVLGVAAACATAGIAAALTALVTPEMPTWPDLKAQSHAWPWAGALTGGLVLVPAITVTLFLLSVVDRATAGWTRRILACAAVLALLGAATAISSGHELRYALLQGIIEGLTTFAFAWLVLRYDLRTVPAFVATGLLLDGAAAATIAGTAGAWIMLALTAVVTIALAWAVMRYLARP